LALRHTVIPAQAGIQKVSSPMSFPTHRLAPVRRLGPRSPWHCATPSFRPRLESRNHLHPCHFLDTGLRRWDDWGQWVLGTAPHRHSGVRRNPETALNLPVSGH